jgi:hypothetical protein
MAASEVSQADQASSICFFSLPFNHIPQRFRTMWVRTVVFPKNSLRRPSIATAPMPLHSTDHRKTALLLIVGADLFSDQNILAFAPFRLDVPQVTSPCPNAGL